MNRKFGLLVVWTGCRRRGIRSRTDDTRPDAASGHAGARGRENRNREPGAGHLHAHWPWRQRGSHGGRGWRRHHRRPVRRHGAEDPRGRRHAQRPAGGVRDQYAPARRSHWRQRCLRQGRRGDHRAGKRAQAARHRAGESIHQRAHRGPRARGIAGGHLRRLGHAAFQRRRPGVHAPAERAHRDRHRGPLSQSQHPAHGRLVRRRLSRSSTATPAERSTA